MAWKTPNGCILEEGDEVVWVDAGNYNWLFTGTVVECLPENDDDNGEVRVDWHGSDGPLTRPDRKGGCRPRVWYFPGWLEKIDSINALDRMAGQL